MAAAGLGGAAVGRMVYRRVRQSRSTRRPYGRWHVVTVNRPVAEVEGGLPSPLASLPGRLIVEFREAPGGRGTEIAVRPTEDNDTRKGNRAIRAALRESRQLLETGEILSADRPGTTERTVTGRALEYATAHGREEGRL